MRFGVGTGEQVFGAEFVLAHEFFNTKGRDLHPVSVPRVDGRVQNQIDRAVPLTKTEKARV